MENSSPCEGDEQIAARETSSTQSLRTRGRFKGRGEFKSHQAIGDRHRNVKVEDGTSIGNQDRGVIALPLTGAELSRCF